MIYTQHMIFKYYLNTVNHILVMYCKLVLLTTNANITYSKPGVFRQMYLIINTILKTIIKLYFLELDYKCHVVTIRNYFIILCFSLFMMNWETSNKMSFFKQFNIRIK